MSVASKTSRRAISKGSPSTTSSPVSEDGATPYDWLDSPTTEPSGQEVALANLSARQAKARGLLTSGTSGPRGTGSLNNIDLQSSLVSRLRARLPLPGGILFKLTWKERTTPAGLLISALRASARGTSGNDSTGAPWPTAAAAARDWKSSASNQHGKNARPLNEVARLASWPTPCQQDGPKGGPGQGTDRLPGAANLASWATPAAAEAGGTPEQFLARKEKLKGACGVSLTSLNLQAQLASWATPVVNDSSSSTRNSTAKRTPGSKHHAGQTLTDQVSGLPVTGSPAETESPGQLDPNMSAWLMGFPPEWCQAAMNAALPKKRKK